MSSARTFSLIAVEERHNIHAIFKSRNTTLLGFWDNIHHAARHVFGNYQGLGLQAKNGRFRGAVLISVWTMSYQVMLVGTISFFKRGSASQLIVGVMRTPRVVTTTVASQCHVCRGLLTY